MQSCELFEFTHCLWIVLPGGSPCITCCKTTPMVNMWYQTTYIQALVSGSVSQQNSIKRIVNRVIDAIYTVRRDQLPLPPCATQTFCPGAPCVATTTEYVTFNLQNEDAMNYMVIRECGLDLSECSGCKREPHFVIFFPGTPHEQVVDTGRCGGQCSQQGDWGERIGGEGKGG